MPACFTIRFNIEASLFTPTGFRLNHFSWSKVNENIREWSNGTSRYLLDLYRPMNFADAKVGYILLAHFQRDIDGITPYGIY
ncbi:hypothetical protein DPMN_123215 [Dreissena polymorpha]|uniref:Uncharacterized protein n=1 Tax=Dreissena polymorpha TaxID=45954 RepID=A0A9D4JRB4_DREPO|nr:hypothetical protein DPMN_123215 [Dreissena polymorpha]